MYFGTHNAGEANSEEDGKIWPAFRWSSSSLFQDSWYFLGATYPLPLLTLVRFFRQMWWNMWLGMSSVLSGRQSGKQSVNLIFIFKSFSLRSSWNARLSIQSHMAAMIGPGNTQLASAGVLEFSRVGGLGGQIFFRVGGGMVHCFLWGQGIHRGGFRRSKPVCLSMAICSCVSMTICWICSDERNGIPTVIGNYLLSSCEPLISTSPGLIGALV